MRKTKCADCLPSPATAAPLTTARPQTKLSVSLPTHLFCLMETPQITAYLKTYCGWSAGVRAILQKHNLQYTEKDIIQNPAFRWEMEQRSGQPLSPCVEIDGQMLPDVSGDEVERYLLEKGLVGENGARTAVPTNSACTDEQHAAMAAGVAPVAFKN